jgi:hypothetical protein
VTNVSYDWFFDESYCISIIYLNYTDLPESKGQNKNKIKIKWGHDNVVF